MPENCSEINQECFKSYLKGRRDAMRDIKQQINFAAVQGYKFPILHLLNYIDKELGLK